MVRLNRIYTRTGDDGCTVLVDGSRVDKDSSRMCAIGDIDELNSAIGLACAVSEDPTSALLRSIQNDLFDLGADVATPLTEGMSTTSDLRITPRYVARLETEIDRLNAPLAPLNSFILPGGSECAARVHLARSIARRAERIVVTVGRESNLNPYARQYLNRLSDLLFVLARSLNQAGPGDPLWVPGRNSMERAEIETPGHSHVN